MLEQIVSVILTTFIENSQGFLWSLHFRKWRRAALVGAIEIRQSTYTGGVMSGDNQLQANVVKPLFQLTRLGIHFNR